MLAADGAVGRSFRNANYSIVIQGPQIDLAQQVAARIA